MLSNRYKKNHPCSQALKKLRGASVCVRSQYSELCINNEIGLNKLLWVYTWERLCGADVMLTIEEYIGICWAQTQQTRVEQEPFIWLNRIYKGTEAWRNMMGTYDVWSGIAKLGELGCWSLVLVMHGCMVDRISHSVDLLLRLPRGYGNHLLQSAFCRPKLFSLYFMVWSSEGSVELFLIGCLCGDRHERNSEPWVDYQLPIATKREVLREQAPW